MGKGRAGTKRQRELGTRRNQGEIDAGKGMNRF
jgi:hypothetical protein